MIRRIIACLDVRDGRVVKGKQFTNISDVDNPESLAEYYSKEGADEIYFYDITASNESRLISKDFINRVAGKTTIPFGIGGGISSLEDIREIFNRGASKVSINSSAVKNPELIKLASLKFGMNRIVLAMDVKKVGEGKWNVFLKGGKEDTGLDALQWASQGEKLGVGEMIINSIGADGTKEGYDIELLKAIKSRVNIPVIASGGAGKMEDFLQVIKEADVEGVLAASVFHFREISIPDLKLYLAKNGIGVTR